MEVAKARVICEKGLYRCELYFINKSSLYALLLLYAVKLRWVFLTEPGANQFFNGIMEEVLQKNFQINYDELLPKEDIISFYSEKYPKLEFWVTIERTGNKYSILNDWTPSVGPLAELVGHYFVLLKKALEYLNEDDKKKSLALLRKIHEMNINSSSVFAAFKYTNMVNKILKEMEEQKTETSNLVFCQKCGKENPATNNYCTNCGAKLTKNELS